MSAAWELLARWPGGTVAALAAADRGLAYAATAAGLHVSADGGRRWSWRGLGPNPVPEALAVLPTDGDTSTLLLGTGAGLFRSLDGGRTWRPALTGSRVQCVAVSGDPSGAGTVLVGTESDGLLRSEDGGLGWDGANAGLLDLNVTALAVSPAFGRDRTAFAGTASGLYRSRNGGRAWRLVEPGPEAPAIQALALSPAFPEDGLVLAGSEADGLFRSEDGGQTWNPVGGFPGPSVTSLAFGPRRGSQPPLAVAGTAAGVAVSRDGGTTWALEAPELGPILAVAVVEAGGDLTILAGTVGSGLRRRDPAGGGWAAADQGLAGRAAVSLAASTAFGSAPLLAVASLDAGVLLSRDGGASWTTGHAGLTDLAASSVAIAHTTHEQPSVLATFVAGLHRSEDLGAGWQPVEIGAGPDARPTVLGAADDTDSGPTTVLAAGPACLALSPDGGASWRPLPLPTPGAEVAGVAVAPTIERDRTLYAVTRATRVTPDGRVDHDGLQLWRTGDLGRSWARWLHVPDAAVMPIAVPQAGDLDASVLVGYGGRVARPLRDAVERRRGERRPLWLETEIDASGATVTALAVSPRARRDRTVLVAADARVYLSRDGGATFAALGDGLDVPLVTALALTLTAADQLTAYALGLGGTLWRCHL